MISVIMPLYNAAKYLPEALQSVLGQTYKDFELICINDCSTDDTGKILKEYREQDARVKILENREHSGAAISRNKGLKEAQGKYVIFLDGDDIFEEELFEKASEAMEIYCVDVVLFESMHVPSETIYTKKVKERSEYFIEDYCKTPFSVKDFGPIEFPNRTDSPWDKMFRRSFLEENRLEFQDLPSSNDVYFVKMALFCAKKIIWLNDRRIMVYARDHFEPSRISADRDPMCAYYAMEKLFLELKEREMIGELAAYWYRTVAAHLMNVMILGKDEERKKSFYLFLHDEGILRCIEYGKEYYDQADAYDRYLLESFLHNTYERGWFRNLATYFSVHLKENGKAVCEFIENTLREKKSVILWGVGVNGTHLLDYLGKCNLKISGIVDSDENKHGMRVAGYEIMKPEILYKNADYIMVTSQLLYRDVKERINDTNIVLINILELLTKRTGYS